MKLSKLSIKRYYEYLDVIDDEDGLEKAVKKAAFITEQPYLKIKREMPVKEVFFNAAKFDGITDDLSRSIPSNSINISGRVFKCVYEAEKMSAGQFIDFMEVTKAYSNNPHNIHAIMAVMCYEGDEYDGKKNSDKEKLFLEEATVGDLFPYAFFLNARSEALKNHIMPYLEKELKKEMGRQIILESVGGGSSYWNAFVKYTARTWMRLRGLVSLSFLIGGLILRNRMTAIGNRFKSKKDQ
jgi:hypothetical protein